MDIEFSIGSCENNITFELAIIFQKIWGSECGGGEGDSNSVLKQITLIFIMLLRRMRKYKL